MLETATDRIELPKRRRAARWLYLGITIFVIALNLVAFAPSITNPSTRTVPLPMTEVVFAHTLISGAWLAVFATQAMLVARGHTALHRRLGTAGALLAVAFVVTTWLAATEGARRGFDLSGDLVARGTSIEAGSFLAPVAALAAFAVCVGAALLYRRRPGAHRRLMLLGLLASTGAPIAHIGGHWPAVAPFTPLLGTLVLFLPALGDRISGARIHPVSLWGAIAVSLYLLTFFVVIARSAMWQSFAVWIVR